jgi:hypothetical protein
MDPRRAPSIALVLLCAVVASGCIVVGRAQPPPPPPPAPAAAPRIDYALGPFTFQMNEGDPIPSYFDSRLLGAAIVDEWERRGYVSGAERVDAGEPAPDAAYHLTVSGAVHAQSSFWAELLNVLTLLTVPYPVTTRYDLQLSVQPSAGGAPVVASGQTAERTWVGLLMVLGVPFAERGHDEEMARLANALYADLRAQGSLAPSGSAPPP